MIWWVILLKLIFGAIAMFFTCAFVLSCISGAINPKIKMNDNGDFEEEGDRSRSIIAIILSISWAIVIAL